MRLPNPFMVVGQFECGRPMRVRPCDIMLDDGNHTGANQHPRSQRRTPHGTPEADHFRAEGEGRRYWRSRAHARPALRLPTGIRKSMAGNLEKTEQHIGTWPTKIPNPIAPYSSGPNAAALLNLKVQCGGGKHRPKCPHWVSF